MDLAAGRRRRVDGPTSGLRRSGKASKRRGDGPTRRRAQGDGCLGTDERRSRRVPRLRGIRRGSTRGSEPSRRRAARPPGARGALRSAASRVHVLCCELSVVKSRVQECGVLIKFCALRTAHLVNLHAHTHNTRVRRCCGTETWGEPRLGAERAARLSPPPDPATFPEPWAGTRGPGATEHDAKRAHKGELG